MKVFIIKVADRHGKTMTYRLTAADMQSVRMLAVRRRWRIIAVREQLSIIRRLFRPSPFSYSELSFLLCQLGNMLGSGVVFVQAFRLLLHDVKGKERRRILEMAAGQMEKGTAISEAVEQTGLFPSTVTGVLKAGERAGNVEYMLLLLGTYYRNADAQRRFLADALTYPVFLLTFTAGVTLAAAFFIIPIFEDMFQQMNMPLPEETQYMLSAAGFLKTAGLAAAAAAFIAAIMAASASCRPAVRLNVERYLLHAPWLRKICLVICWQRFSQIISMQMRCGISVLPALEDGLAAVPSLWFGQAMRDIAGQLEKGRSFSQSVRRSRISTAYVETLLMIGETTGRYEDTFQSIADYYDWQLRRWSGAVHRFLGPAVIVIVGIFVGFVILSLVMPLLDMTAGIMVM